MSDYVSLNLRMYARKRDKVLERVILNLGWEYYAASKATEYARKILKKRWKEAEPIIKKIPYQCYIYSRHVIQGKWKDAEPTIATCANSSYLYAKYVLKDRFYMAEEKNIWNDPRDIYLYSKYVMKSRWVEKEKCIKKYIKNHMGDGYFGYSVVLDSIIGYSSKFCRKRLPGIENSLMQGSLDNIKKYYDMLDNSEDKELFYNKILAHSLVEPAHSWVKNSAAEFIKLGLK